MKLVLFGIIFQSINIQNSGDHDWGTPFEAQEIDNNENNWCNIDEVLGDNFSNYEISKEYIKYNTLMECKVESLYGTDKLEYRLVSKCFVTNNNEGVFNSVDHIDRQEEATYTLTFNGDSDDEYNDCY
ncbi:unnamed protein product [Cunninghamella echinulata]